MVSMPISDNLNWWSKMFGCRKSAHKEFAGLSSLHTSKISYMFWLWQADKDNHVLHVTDSGIGMTKRREPATTAVATSEFLTKFGEAASQQEASDLIGQFGVGFYSSFLGTVKKWLILYSIQKIYALDFIRWDVLVWF